MDVDSAADSARKRAPTACEACRATKIKCQPSDQPGVCRKCLEAKKECVSRTGPRIRRRRAQLIQDSLNPTPPAASAPSTFTIDFAVPAHPEVEDDFESLRGTHATILDQLFPSNDPLESLHMDEILTPPASSSQSHSIQDLHAKPQFNLSSAESLLDSFRSMLPHYPCILLPRDATVQTLAASHPFVLLAILASASGSKTLQGHSLYDEEFRKVLGLKFVAGGERSLELLQGLLIYCAWYPFHLRPRNKQAFQYLRMASDLVHDLELDQDFRLGFAGSASAVTDQQLDNIRTYLAYYYSGTTFVAIWRKHRGSSAVFSPWTATCCDILESNAQVNEDIVLAWLVRLANTASDAFKVIHEPSGHTEQQSRLVLLGLEAQFRDMQERMPPQVTSTSSIRMATMFVSWYLDAGALLRIPRLPHAQAGFLLPMASKLCTAVTTLRVFLDFVTSLDEADFLCFTGVEWSRIILAVILAIRLSLPPLPECPEWDAAWARSRLGFDEFLTHMCRDTDLTASSKRVDVLSASRVVMRMVKEKYERRLAIVATSHETPGKGTCPMLDGSLEEYFPFWDAGLGIQPTMESDTEAQTQPVFHDLWATMTMSWADEIQENT